MIRPNVVRLIDVAHAHTTLTCCGCTCTLQEPLHLYGPNSGVKLSLLERASLWKREEVSVM